MRKFIYILLGLGILNTYHSIQAQNRQQLDSLIAEFRSTDDQVSQLGISLTIGNLFAYTDQDSSIFYGAIAMDISKNISDTLSLIEALDLIGWAYYDLGKQDTSKEIHLRAHHLAKISNNKNAIAKSAFNLGYINQIAGEYQKAVSYFEQALEVYQSTPNPTIDIQKKLSKTMNNLGLCQYEMGNDSLAIRFYKGSLSIREELGDTLGMGRSHNNIGGMYYRQGNYIRAMDHFQNARKIYLSIDATTDLSMVLLHIGDVHHGLGDLETAQQHFDTALKIGNEKNIKFTIAAALTGIGNIQFDQKLYKESISSHSKALEIRQSLNWKCYALENASTLIDCYFILDIDVDSLTYYQGMAEKLASNCGETTAVVKSLVSIGNVKAHSKAFSEAESSYLRGLKMSQKLNNPGLEKVLLDKLYLLYKSRNKPNKALEYLEYHDIVKDSLINQDKIKKTIQLEEQYKYEQEKQQLISEQEKETLILEVEKQQAENKQQYALIGLVIIGLATGTLLWAFFKYKKLSYRLVVANDELNQVNEYRTRLFANINHDFRTPLTLINGYIDRITSNKSNYLTEQSETDLSHLENNTALMTNMTQEIQNLLLLEEGKLELSWNALQIVPMIRLTTNMFESQAKIEGKKLQMEVQCDEDVVVHLDKMYFKKILYNLLSNAFRYTRSGDGIFVSLFADDQKFKIEVRDTGIGIKENHLPYIFDRFYQSPDNDYQSKEGFGIGLSLVKELIALHGGEIRVVSQLEEGTTFVVSLPFNYDKEITFGEPEFGLDEMDNLHPPIALKQATSHSLAEKEHNVLVVDDHQEIREYIASVIDGEYAVRQAVHGQHALDILEKESIDLIITDLMMPWLDGFQLIEKIQAREQFQHIPILVVSARTTEEDRLKVLDAGVNDFISKPFDADKLKKRIRNQIRAIDKGKANTWQAIAQNKDIQSNVEQNIIKKVNQLIIDRIDDPNLTVEDLANEICASRRKTFRLIKSLTDQSPKAYIKNIRLEYINGLIKSKKIKNVTEGARAIGMLNGTEFKNQYIAKFEVEPFA